MKIIDCFIFYNELDLLTYRFNLLNNIVDYFIIVESTNTFVGKEKKLFFNENKHLFENFSNKIIHIIVDDLPYKYHNVNIDINNVWNNEIFQRNAISRGINYIKDLSQSDVIIISDLDEIPDPYTLDKIKKSNIIVDFNILEMDLYYYNLNTRFQIKWHLCKIISYKKYNELNISCNSIRDMDLPHSIILNGGWHLSYFGDKYFIQNKIQNFSCQELNTYEYTDLEKIEKRIQNNTDLFNRNFNIERIKIEDNTYLPIDYSKYLNKYYNNIKRMNIIDLYGNKVDIEHIEKPEQDLANQYILENDIVLELGARYGSVSCIINSKLNNKKNQVVVEPDDRVWDALEKNKVNNNCEFNIVKGFISNKKLDLTNLDVCLNGYGATFIESNDTKIPSYSLDEIKIKYNLKFNVLVADCEGFLEVFFDENPFFYDNLRLIIFEADYSEKCNYDKIKNKLIEKNFNKIIEGHQNVWINPAFEM